MSEHFDGENWACSKCSTEFNLLQVTDYRCPKCNRQVSLKEILEKPIRYVCSFQTLITVARGRTHVNKYLGLGCQLTARGIGAGAVVGYEYYSKCYPSRCPIHKTWKLLEKQEKAE